VMADGSSVVSDDSSTTPVGGNAVRPNEARWRLDVDPRGVNAGFLKDCNAEILLIRRRERRKERIKGDDDIMIRERPEREEGRRKVRARRFGC
jgi:hypothetical protein